MSEISLKEWLKKYRNGKFDNPSREIMCDAGWYDWFCNDEELYRRFKRIAPKIEWFAELGIVDLDKTYVFLKNNCPLVGNLYDDFRICDLKTGEVIFTIVPKSGHKNQELKAELWGRVERRTSEGFKLLINTKNWSSLKLEIIKQKEYLRELYLKNYNPNENNAVKKIKIKPQTIFPSVLTPKLHYNRAYKKGMTYGKNLERRKIGEIFINVVDDMFGYKYISESGREVTNWKDFEKFNRNDFEKFFREILKNVSELQI